MWHVPARSKRIQSLNAKKLSQGLVGCQLLGNNMVKNDQTIKGKDTLRKPIWSIQCIGQACKTIIKIDKIGLLTANSHVQYLKSFFVWTRCTMQGWKSVMGTEWWISLPLIASGTVFWLKMFISYTSECPVNRDCIWDISAATFKTFCISANIQLTDNE